MAFLQTLKIVMVWIQKTHFFGRGIRGALGGRLLGGTDENEMARYTIESLLRIIESVKDEKNLF